MKSISIIFLVIISLFLISGCNNINYINNIDNSYDNFRSNNTNNNNNDNIIILTTFFPTQEITEKLLKGNNKTSTINTLIPVGTEPHNYQPSVKSIMDLSKSDLFIIMGGMFNQIENKIIDMNNNNNNDNPKNNWIIDSTKGIKLLEKNNENDNNKFNFIINSNHQINNPNIDPHIWLSIDNMITMTKNIKEALIDNYPEQKNLIENNSKKYINKLNKLKLEYKTELSNCKQNKILVNHMAFGYIAKEYNFSQISVSGFNPETEPSPKTIQNIIDTAKKYNLKYVFIENQLDSKITETIANDINGKVFTMNVIKEDKNQSYIELMKENLKNLKIALECSD